MAQAIGKDYQPQVKDAGNVLVGVAQVRVGLPSIRPTGTAIVKALQYVGLSALMSDTSTGATINYIDPTDTSAGGVLPAGCVAVASGTYTGAYDGNFMIRYNGTTWDIFSPAGYQDAAVTTSAMTTGKPLNISAATPSGVTLTGVLATTPVSGMTFVLPVWSGLAQSKPQTGICTPYSMFQGSAESIGGLKTATFTPAISSIKTLETGFPSQVIDRVIEKIDVTLKAESLEYNNANVQNLKNMMLTIMQNLALPAIAFECVMRTRNNNLVCFWCPNSSIMAAPSYAPTNDFSSMTWELGGTKQSQVTGETAAYNIMLANTNLYEEITYLH